MELSRAKALYRTAFPQVGEAFCERLFSLCRPEYLRTATVNGETAAMLLSLPARLHTASGVTDARYLYGVATHPAYRGQGLAQALLRAETALDRPVFLRPLRAELFEFYRKAGLSPISPCMTLCGEAKRGREAFLKLSPAEYAGLKCKFCAPPFTETGDEVLALLFSAGGAVYLPDRFLALYCQRGKTLLFKEVLGDTARLPEAAAFLGADTYTARLRDPSGTPFGVGTGLPADTHFFTALD